MTSNSPTPPDRSPAVKDAPTWKAFAVTAQGGSHVKKGLENQDAVLKGPDSPTMPAYIAVADGHGSDPYFRSSHGSRFAVRCVLRILQDEVDTWCRSEDVAFPNKFKQEVPQKLVKEWRALVEQHLDSNPFDEREGKLNARFPNQSAYNPYGSTCLGAAICEKGLLVIQLGDGDSLFVKQTGEVSHFFPDDPNLIANETTSLCMPGAEKHVKCKVFEKDAHEFDMFMLTTDGLPNLFHEEKFPDLVNQIRAKLALEPSVKDAESNLTRFLEKLTLDYDGDDVSIAVLKKIQPGDKLGQVVAEAAVRDQLSVIEQKVDQTQAIVGKLAEEQAKQSADIAVLKTAIEVRRAGPTNELDGAKAAINQLQALLNSLGKENSTKESRLGAIENAQRRLWTFVAVGLPLAILVSAAAPFIARRGSPAANTPKVSKPPKTETTTGSSGGSVSKTSPGPGNTATPTVSPTQGTNATNPSLASDSFEVQAREFMGASPGDDGSVVLPTTGEVITVPVKVVGNYSGQIVYTASRSTKISINNKPTSKLDASKDEKPYPIGKFSFTSTVNTLTVKLMPFTDKDKVTVIDPNLKIWKVTFKKA